LTKRVQFPCIYPSPHGKWIFYFITLLFWHDIVNRALFYIYSKNVDKFIEYLKRAIEIFPEEDRLRRIKEIEKFAEEQLGFRLREIQELLEKSGIKKKSSCEKRKFIRRSMEFQRRIILEVR
ncbi:MAG: hypothetical protein N2V75_07490, partial [Methanophagales archaeon]|nr:hypothetical protein [Methanophagales archaeon]